MDGITNRLCSHIGPTATPHHHIDWCVCVCACCCVVFGTVGIGIAI